MRMRTLCRSDSLTGRRGERGGSRVNFLIVIGVIAALGYVGFQLIPVLFHANTFESYMQDTVNNAAVTDKNSAWVEQQLKKGFADYDIPPEAVAKCVVNNGRLEAHVQYTRMIPLIVTQYEYTFDKTVQSSTTVSSAG